MNHHPTDRPGRITPHRIESPRRARVPWFCASFVAMLCALAFLAGMTFGILATLRFVGKSAPPPMREIVEQPMPRVHVRPEPAREVFEF